jgi:ribonuclease T2
VIDAGAVPISVPGYAIAAVDATHIEAPTAADPRRIEPIGGYTLALLWTPEHCTSAVPGAETFACTQSTPRGLILHGLWPDGLGNSWPQWCRPAPLLPPATIAAVYRATPSAQLLQHEWAKHGTCMTGSPSSYFRRSTRLFDALRQPDLGALAGAPTTTGAIAQAFVAANPWLRPDMLRFNLSREGWLREAWLCLDRRFHPSRCKEQQSDRPARIRTDWPLLVH